MTSEKAREILLANACCQLGYCNKCPLFTERIECLDVDNMLEDAIDVIYEEVKKYAKN